MTPQSFSALRQGSQVFTPSISQSLTVGCPWEKDITSLDNLPGIFRVGSSHLAKGKSPQKYTAVSHQYQTHSSGRVGPPTVWGSWANSLPQRPKTLPGQRPIPAYYHIRDLISESCVYVPRRRELEIRTQAVHNSDLKSTSLSFSASFKLATMNMH